MRSPGWMPQAWSVRAVRATGERFDPASRADDDARDLVYRPRPEDPRVTLRLASAAEWVVESHPHESATRADDGTWQVVLAISEPAWLERLLVALGPDATVVAPADLTELGAEAAGRLRRRYGTT